MRRRSEAKVNVKILIAIVGLGGVFLTGVLLRPEVGAPEASAPRMLEERPVQLEGEGNTLMADLVIPPAAAAPEAVPPVTSTPVAAEAVASAPSAPSFPEELVEAGWDARVGAARAVWVSVSQQRLTIFEGRVPIWSEQCATALNGIGSEMGSHKTPLGWHSVSEKMGDGAPWGQVFRSRAATKEVWKPGGNTKEDLVLTRLLWLDGLEPGKNKGRNAAGKNVDSKQRCIYIHGTNAEEQIGTPTSHGCVRLTNDNVIEVYELLPVGTLVLITE